MSESQRLGRKPLGPGLVHHLEGSEHAKLRLEVILETIAGRWTVAQACQKLDIGEAMFHRLRNRVLQAGLAHLEPRPLGRPPQSSTTDPQHVATLEDEVRELTDQLSIAQVRLEIAQTMPHLLRDAAPETDAAVKKTTGRKSRSPRQRLLTRKQRQKRPR